MWMWTPALGTRSRIPPNPTTKLTLLLMAVRFRYRRLAAHWPKLSDSTRNPASQHSKTTTLQVYKSTTKNVITPTMPEFITTNVLNLYFFNIPFKNAINVPFRRFFSCEKSFFSVQNCNFKLLIKIRVSYSTYPVIPNYGP